MAGESALSDLPSVDRLLRSVEAADLIERHGRMAVVAAFRSTLAAEREIRLNTSAIDGESRSAESVSSIVERATRYIDQRRVSPLRRVFNLTGTVLHTNLGRAQLPEEAIEAIVRVARGASNLEYDLLSGERGERDDHVEALLCELTGAEAATVVNNNAAAILLVLRSLANRREVPISRGELIEIGGSFRLPEIIHGAGCRLREVGTTNRTHLSDFSHAIGPRTGAVLKAHSSNFEIRGFTASADEGKLAALCRERGVPFVVDLGSGALTDLRIYGLTHEPTPRETLARGADIVTFSGDKLLGGPQAGVIVGRADLVSKIRRNPLKRALRLDKLTLAALSAVLYLHSDPQQLVESLPTLRLLARPASAVREAAERVLPACAAALEKLARVDVVACESQIGSGSQPLRTIESAGISIRPSGRAKAGVTPREIAAAFRALPVPVVGRIQRGSFILDLRTLEEESTFIAQLAELRFSHAVSR